MLVHGEAIHDLILALAAELQCLLLRHVLLPIKPIINHHLPETIEEGQEDVGTVAV